MAVDDGLLSLARSQCGALSREQVRALGVSAKAELLRVQRGQWSRSGRVLVVNSVAREGDHLDAWKLQLEVGPQAIVSGPVAARLGGWEFPGEERIVILNVHDAFVSPGIRVLRRENPAWPVRPTGLRVASPLDAFADTVICRPIAQARSLVDFGLQQRWIDAESFDELIGHRAGHGRRGVGRLRMLRQRVVSGMRSEAEHRMDRLLHSSQTGRWHANFPVTDARGRIVAEIDFALANERIAIEVDGRAFHTDRQAFEKDRQRQNRLVLQGWTVLRFTWEQITDAPQAVVAVIQQAVEDARRNLG